MGFFSKKPKLGLKEIFDLSKYPDDSFIADKIHSADDRDVYVKFEPKNKFFGIFSELSIVCFKNTTGRNFIFKCYSYEFEKYNLPDLIQKIYNVYGKDDDGLGLYLRKDSDDIDKDFWLGRSWTNSRFPDAGGIYYTEEDGLSFTIWTK